MLKITKRKLFTEQSNKFLSNKKVYKLLAEHNIALVKLKSDFLIKTHYG